MRRAMVGGMSDIPAPKKTSTWSAIQNKVLVGVLTILPLTLVWFVLSFLVDFLSWLGRPLIAGLAVYFGWNTPGGWLQQPFVLTTLAVLAALWLIYVIGAIASNVIGARLIAFFSNILNRVPVVKQVYGAAQKLVQSLTGKPAGGQRVVLLPFPNSEMRAIGFVTKTFLDATTGEELAAVYMPTSPNPTSGYLEIVALSKCVPTDLTVDQAMNMILSGGATAPDRVLVGAPPPG